MKRAGICRELVAFVAFFAIAAGCDTPSGRGPEEQPALPGVDQTSQSATAKCTNGTTRCGTGENNFFLIQTCTNGVWGKLTACSHNLICNQGTNKCFTHCSDSETGCSAGTFCGPEDGKADTACYPAKKNGAECDWGDVCISGSCNLDTHQCCAYQSSPNCVDYRSP
jgi:hypothetical protein